MNIASVKIETVYRNLFPVFFFLISFSLQAQHQFNGKVLDAETDWPVSAFTIWAYSTEGYYSFSLSVSSAKTNLQIHLIPENVTIQEVTVKAFNSEKRLRDTPGSIGLINNRQLLQEPSFTLAPSVNKVAGIWMQSGSINTNRMTIRGIGTRSPYGSNKIRAYYGDIPLTNGVGETTLEDLDLEQIADIEIIKGPASGFYGSGLGGVLLFNPLTPVKSQFAQQVSIGSFQTIKYTAKIAIAGSNAGHSLVYSRIHSDGYRENNATNRHNF